MTCCCALYIYFEFDDLNALVNMFGIFNLFDVHMYFINGLISIVAWVTRLPWFLLLLVSSILFNLTYDADAVVIVYSDSHMIHICHLVLTFLNAICKTNFNQNQILDRSLITGWRKNLWNPERNFNFYGFYWHYSIFSLYRFNTSKFIISNFQSQ